MRGLVLIIISISLLSCYDDEETVGKENTEVSSDTPPESYIPNIGDSAWRNSKDNLCPALDMEINASIGIWSDNRGVFVSVGGEEAYRPDAEEEKTIEYGGEVFNCADGCPVGTVLFNDGSGWKEIYGFGMSFGDMKGIPNGELLFYGGGRWDSGTNGQCGLYTLENGEVSCVAKGDTFIREIFVVNDRLAYALLIDGGIMKFDGESWEPLAVPPPRRLSTIWANEDILFADGLSYSEEQWKVYEKGEGANFIWGFAADDVWAVQSSPTKIYHFDGKTWETLYESWPFSRHSSCENDWSQQPITGIWGSDGVLYVYSYSQIARLENGNIDLILDLPCIEFNGDPWRDSLGIASLWGNSKDEVFVLVWDGSQYETECGTVRAMFYDGTGWNWF